MLLGGQFSLLDGCAQGLGRRVFFRNRAARSAQRPHHLVAPVAHQGVGCLYLALRQCAAVLLANVSQVQHHQNIHPQAVLQ